MALSITVHGQGTFTASMEEGPVTFTAAIASVGPQGATGATGATGVVAATAPITYNSGTQTVGIDDFPTFTGVIFGAAGQGTIDQNGITFPSDGSVQTTAFIGEARKEYLTARNNTGTTIGAGKVVYLSGATGNKPTVALALADSETTSARTIGVTAESIANNADGKVIISGAVENIDTSAFTAGDTLYLSATTAGGYTTSLPAAPLHGVVIGIVTRANPSVGSIEVAIQNYQELKELSDVSVSDRANNDGLFWESSSSTWRSKTIAEILGYTPANNASVLLSANNLSDLASASTARTNLGLGTMAVETASNYLTSATASTTYAPLASPTFTGDPKAPTPSTSDNDTSIATTAFVNAYCPTASTSTAGKSRFSTDAEAAVASNNLYAVGPMDAALAAMSTQLVSLTYASYSAATSGTGANANSSTTAYGGVIIGPNASTAGYAVRGYSVHFTSVTSNQQVNWSKVIGFSARIYQTTAYTNNTFRMTFGKSAATIPASGTLTSRGFGIEFDMSTRTVSLLSHNGTTLTTTASTFTSTLNRPFDVVVLSDGTGNVTLYINGSQVATNTGGPTTAVSPSQIIWHTAEVEAGSSNAANAQVGLYNLKSFIER